MELKTVGLNSLTSHLCLKVRPIHQVSVLQVGGAASAHPANSAQQSPTVESCPLLPVSQYPSYLRTNHAQTCDPERSGVYRLQPDRQN